MTTVVQLTSSRFFGGPERQMLELAASLPDGFRSLLVSFCEGGRCEALLERASRRGFPAMALRHDTPHLAAALGELVRLLRGCRADLLCCHGYKSNLLGLLAARRIGIPVISVSRGWTGESLRVRLYERLDRLVLRGMNRVVCVSNGQARKVCKAGVPKHRTVVIHNAVRADRFAQPIGEYRTELRRLFPEPPDLIVGAAGRLSKEKGFHVLVDAAAKVTMASASVGFVLFGDGRLREPLGEQIRARGLQRRFVLAGFQQELDRYLPHLDLMVLPSFTEGLPNVVLESLAAGVAVVATDVGGTPEVVCSGENGLLVPPGDRPALARRITEMLADDQRRREMGRRGRTWVKERFSFASQARAYQRLFDDLVPAKDGPGRPSGRPEFMPTQARACHPTETRNR